MTEEKAEAHMHPSHFAATTPDKPAYIMAKSGEVVTYRQLEERSNQGAHLLRSLGIVYGDCIAICMENNARYLETIWALQRSGVYFALLSSKLSSEEVDYIVRDSGAKVLISSAALADLAAQLPGQLPDIALFMTGGARAGWRDWDAECAAMPRDPIADQAPGVEMLYSSGTTGRPKGIRLPLPKPNFPGDPVGTTPPPLNLYGMTGSDVYLSPAPLYHTAPLKSCINMHRWGGTVIVMEAFDPEFALSLIETWRVTHAQFVPTHFIRMLKLPEDIRNAYDLSSLKVAFHAAAPCPIPVKEQMLAWWGPIIHEYYSGTEAIGMTVIGPHDWLTHKGSVGRAVRGEIRICDEAGDPVPARTEGGVYFANGPSLTYHNAPEKVAESTNKNGWKTYGDVGWVDEDGYLYLTDRKSFMIISGGVNIYPQEIENLLVTHPKVADVAVIGAPDAEMGEKVLAVVQPLDWTQAGDKLAEELIAFARAHISHVKAPRKVEFMETLPRLENGKLYKRLIRDAYWGAHTTGSRA